MKQTENYPHHPLSLLSCVSYISWLIPSAWIRLRRWKASSIWRNPPPHVGGYKKHIPSSDFSHTQTFLKILCGFASFAPFARHLSDLNEPDSAYITPVLWLGFFILHSAFIVCHLRETHALRVKITRESDAAECESLEFTHKTPLALAVLKDL